MGRLVNSESLTTLTTNADSDSDGAKKLWAHHASVVVELVGTHTDVAPYRDSKGYPLHSQSSRELGHTGVAAEQVVVHRAYLSTNVHPHNKIKRLVSRETP